MSAMIISKIGKLASYAIVIIALTAFGQGCETDTGTSCYPGDQQACTCANSNAGFQPCNVAGNGYNACDCNEMTGSSSSSSSSSSGTGGAGGATGTGGIGGAGGAGGAGGSGALLPFMAQCMDSSQCETMLCFTYNAGVSFCTKNCTNDADCPVPSPGCNNMGVCKKP